MQPPRLPLPVGFRDVDATAPAKILHCFDCLQSMAAGQAYEARTLELRAREPVASTLEVACDLGVDRSRTLIAAALPFPDASFEAVRIDRALQQIADPGRVVGEMVPVARRGAVVL